MAEKVVEVVVVVVGKWFSLGIWDTACSSGSSMNSVP